MIKTGLLWYDADPRRALEDKVRLAAQRYRQKYGRPADVCYVHPKAVGGESAAAALPLPLGEAGATIHVVAARTILLHHFWVGESDRADRP
jgi:hypothetical protein